MPYTTSSEAREAWSSSVQSHMTGIWRRLPSDTLLTLSFREPRAYSDSSALSSVSAGGGSMKSKFMRSWMPRDLSIRTTLPVCVEG